MANIGTVQGEIRLTDAFNAPLANLDKAITRMEARLSRLTAATGQLNQGTKRAGSGFGSFGNHIKNTLIHVGTAVVAYKGLAAAISSVGKNVEFERTLTKITNLTSTSSDEVVRFKTELHGIRAATGRGPQELAEGFLAIASTGSHAAETTERLAASAKLAAIGLGETNTIGRALSATINAYGRENISAAQAADQLLATVREGGAEATEIAGVLGRVVGVAKLMGVSFAEVGASIATFTRLGVGADEAVTALRGTMMAMLNPSKSANDALAAMGTSMAELRQQVKDKGLAVALIDLVKATKGNDEAIADIIPNVRALAGVLANAGSQADAYQEILTRIEGSTGDLDDAMKQLQASPAMRWDQLKAQFESLALTLGESLLPGFEALGNALASVDPGTLREFGSDAARVLSALASILKVLVDNLHLLKAALLGLLAFKVAAAIEGWVVAVRAWIVATTTATATTATFGSTIAALAGPIGIAVAALFALSEAAKKYVRDAQVEIDRLVVDTNAAGEALARLRGMKNTEMGAFVSRETFTLMQKDMNAAAAAVERLSRERNELFNPQNLQSFLTGEKTLTQAINDEGYATRKAIEEKERQIEQQRIILKSTSSAISLVRNFGQVIEETAQKEEEATVTIKELDSATLNFMQRVEETTQRLEDQLEVARALNAEALMESRRRVRGNEGELALIAQVEAQRLLSQEKRIQLAIDKQIAALETAKLKVTDEVRERIKRSVRETIELEDQTDLVVARTAVLVKKWEEVADRQQKTIRELQDAADEIEFSKELEMDRLDTTREMLAAWIEGGSVAARTVEINAELVRQNKENERTGGVILNNTEALAKFYAEIEEEVEKVTYLLGKMSSLMKPQWQIYADAAFDAFDLIFDTLAGAFEEFLNTGQVNWDNLWENLKSSAISIFVDMLADMFKRWLAQQAAMAATDYAANSGGGGMGGGGGWMNMLSGMFGGGGGAAGVTAKGSAGKTAAGMGKGSAAGGAGGAGGSLAAAGWAAAIVAIVLAARNQMKTSGRAESDTEIVFGQGQGMALGPNSRHNSQVSGGQFQRQLEAVQKLIDDVVKFIGSLGGTIDKTVQETSRLLVGREGRGKKTNWFVKYADGLVKHFGSDMEAAFEFAMVQAIRQAPTVGLSPEVRTALANTAAETMDQLQADIDTALSVLRSRIGDVGADIYDIYRAFEEQIAAAEKLGLATSDLVAARNREIQAVRNQLLGIDTSTADFLASLKSFNDGMDETSESMRAGILARIEELRREMESIMNPAPGQGGPGGDTDKPHGGRGIGGGLDDGGPGATVDFSSMDPRIVELQRQIDEYLAELDRIPKALSDQELSMAVFDALYKYVEGSAKYEADRLKWARLKVELEFAAIKAQLVALGKWEEFAALFNDAYAAALRAAGKKPGGGGKGVGGGGDRGSDRDSIRREVGGFGLSPMETAIRETNLWLADFTKRIQEAGFSTAEAARLIGEAQEEANRRIAEIKGSLVDRFQEFMGTVSPFDKIRKNAQGLIDDIEDSPFGNARKARMIGRIMEEVDRQITRLANEMALGLFGEMLGDLEKFGADEQLMMDVRRNMAIIEHALKMEHYRTELEILRASGRIAPEVMAKLDEAFKFLEGVDPTQFLQGGGGSDYTPGTGTTIPGWRDENGVFHPYDPSKAGTGMEDAANDLKRATDMLNGYIDDGMSELARTLKKINEDFDFIGKTLGNTAQVTSERAKAINRAITEWLEPVVEARRAMDFGDQSVLRGDQQFALVQQQFRGVAQKMLGGDLDQRDRLLELAEQYRELAQGFTGGEAFRFIDSEIKGIFDRIIAMTGGESLTDTLASLGLPSNPMTIQSPELTSSIEDGNVAVLGELRSHTTLLTTIRNENSAMRALLADPLTVRNIA
jgi:TP901 family phage tail tape measure protein